VKRFPPRRGTIIQDQVFIHLSKYAMGCYLRYCGFPRRTFLGILVNKRCYYVVLFSLSPAHYAKYYTGQSCISENCSSRTL